MTAAPTMARTPDWVLRRIAAPVEDVLVVADEVPVLAAETELVAVEVMVVEEPVLVVVATLPVDEAALKEKNHHVRIDVQSQFTNYC